ncbi:hypothetical protein P4O66_000732 [Electrophorus voltai]|uniref:Uncharacterized protein n=1 Tax=Electrophorus voltai TaxID=2609070 RepID=A0AAD9DXT5_9TELE|nr:hypothetical protein P4O66_000732 [Electrophorus voltai]
MPGKGSKKRKGKKGGKRPSTTRAVRPSVILATLPPLGRRSLYDFGGPPITIHGRTLWSPTDPSQTLRTGTRRWTPLGLTTTTWTSTKGTQIMENTGSAVTLVCGWMGVLTMGRTRSMEMEEVLYGDPSNSSDIASADSESDEAPALQIPPKAPPRRCCSGASKPSQAAQRGAIVLEHTLPTRAYSPGTRAPVPKPRRGKGEASPMPAPETGKATCAPTVVGAWRSPSPKSASGDPPQAGGTPAQRTTGGPMGLQSAFEDCKRLCCPDSKWKFIPPSWSQDRKWSRCLSSMRPEASVTLDLQDGLAWSGLIHRTGEVCGNRRR